MKLHRRSAAVLGSALLLSTTLYGLRGSAVSESAPSAQAYSGALADAVEMEQSALEARTDLWQDHSTWANAWAVKGEHYTVRTIHSRFLGEEVLRGQETMRAYFEELLQGGVTPSTPTPIFLFPDRTTYNAFGDEHGEFHSSIMGGFYAPNHPNQPVATYLDASRTRPQMWVTHNTLHQYLATNFNGEPPVWVSEGLASYFALFWDFKYGVRELESLKASDRLLPFQNLLSEDLSAYPSDPHARFIQLGMMFTYLLRFNETTRRLPGELEPIAPFDEFLRAAVRGERTADMSFMLYMAEEREDLVAGFMACEFE